MLEVYYVVYGVYEIEVFICIFFLYEINGKFYLLGFYICIFFVSIFIDELKVIKYVWIKILGEFGFGNIFLDIFYYKNKGKDYILMFSFFKVLICIDFENIFI